MKYKIFDFTADRVPNEEGPWFYLDEWIHKPHICKAFAGSKSDLNAAKVDARKCEVEQVNEDEAGHFLSDYHLQGNSRRSSICFGLRYKGELLGVLSLAPHHRQGHENTIVLDRVCFKAGVTVRGGLSRLLSYCVAWSKEENYDMIITFSDNRLTDGKVYEKVGFVFDGNIRYDYFYVDKDNRRYSKQSQKKKAVKCPADMTELQWAEARGLRRIYDLGKRRWVLKLNPNVSTKKEKLSALCAQQHAKGIFKKNHIRGDYDWRGKSLYFGSSWELRFLYESQSVVHIKNICRADHFVNAKNKSRNPDYLVEYIDGRKEIVEIKPSSRVHEFHDQIQDSKDYAAKMKLDFRVWTEQDSEIKDERQLIRWARKYLASIGQPQFLTDSMRKNREKAVRHYNLRLKDDKVTVHCKFCSEDHTIRREQYESNVEKNGRFICIKENGHIVGSRSKVDRNPYHAEGKKKCSGACGSVLPLDDFSVNNKKTGQRCSQCKKCRAAKATKKYRDDKIK